MTIIADTPDRFKDFRQQIYQHGAEVDVYAPETYQGEEEPIRKKRRMRRPGFDVDDPRLAMTLTEVDGVLRWSDGYGFRRASGLRRSRMGLGVQGEIVAPINFEKLEPSKIGEYLRKLDAKLTPQCNFEHPEQGIRELVNGTWQNAGVRPISKGRLLIFIHGTFSKSEMFLEELKNCAEGKSLLQKLQNKENYDQILAFDHATLAVSPVLNAMDLASIFKDCHADVDVICHSRGGLVTRWWIETYRHQRGITRAVLVGSPLAGTSLAAAPRLRASINLLTNVARALQLGTTVASTTFPFFTVITGLLKVLGSIGTIAGKAPIFDAAVALIPGLASQAMVSNAEELNRLNRSYTNCAEYYAVRSAFAPTDPGWEFWKYFTQVGDRVKEWAADLVFAGANDLVVDTASMTVLAKPPHAVDITRLYDFKTNPKVYHTVYFQQDETAKFIADCFKL